MKKYLATLFLFFTVFSVSEAQNRPTKSAITINPEQDSIESKITNKLTSEGTKIDTSKVALPNIYVWKITPRLGERTFIPRDTTIIDFHRSMQVDGQSVAMGYLGNIGSPAQSKIFFERPEASSFAFQDPLQLWRKNPEDHLFFNTKVPYSEIKYQSGGGGETSEKRFQAEISINSGKRLNFGFDFDYIYSRGFYTSLANKGVSYDLYASYIGDKYKMHAFFNNNNFTLIENGGIADTTYISNPNSDRVKNENFSGNSLDIPVRMQNTWNKLRGRHLYVTNRYDLGNDTEEYAINDSVVGTRKKANYTPLASVIFTTHYTDQRRRFISEYQYQDEIYGVDKKYPYNGGYIDNPLYSTDANDFWSYYSFKNTFALAMNEGFRKWTKFGLTAFIEYDIRKYSLPLVTKIGESSTILPGFQTHVADKNPLIIGGLLTKEKGKYLRYRLAGELDITNQDYKLEGEVTTSLKFKGKDFSVKAKAHIKKVKSSFFENTFVSKYWSWENDFSHTNRKYIGGEIIFPNTSFSETKISGGFELISNQIYYDKDSQIKQDGSETLIYSLRLDQKFNVGIFHWDSEVVWQESNNLEVIPLPKLSVYTNLYLTTKVAKVLTVQLGADAQFHTKYYMPGYEPLTMQFYNQRDMELGGFPFVSAYVNMHLKYTRFFIMMYNVAQGTGNGQSFSLYRYPVNSRGLKLGLSWRFNN